MPLEVIDYARVRQLLPTGRSHLLLGNGFSISCNPIFNYGSLFEFAKREGRLSDKVVEVFGYLGTNNFEGVMRALDDTSWIASHYGVGGLADTLKPELESVKKGLLEAVAKTHLPDPSRITDDRKRRCSDFLAPFHNIFSTNYDLLLYWVEMFDQTRLGGKDGFRSDVDNPDEPYVVFSERLGGEKGIFFVHGALHLYVVDGEIRKHCWERTGRTLIEGIKEGLRNGQYPLFVAEGSPEKKLEQIRRNGYLYYCLEKLRRVENALVILGLSLGDSDTHLTEALADNQKLEKVYFGLHGEADSPGNLRTRQAVEEMKERRNRLVAMRRARAPLQVVFFNSGSIRIWD